MIAARALDDGDQIFDVVPDYGVTHGLQGVFKINPVVLHRGRFQQDSSVEIGEHHFRAGFGAVDTQEGKMFWPHRLDTWVNHAARLVDRVRLSFPMILRLGFDCHRTEPPK